MKKLLVTDIDGTIAHGDHITGEAVDICRALRAEGWEILLATGRILASAGKYFTASGALPRAIVYDGARIMDFTSGEEIWGRKLDPQVVESVLASAWDLPLGVQVFGDESVLCRRNDDLARRYFSSIGVPVDGSLDRPAPVEGVYRIIFYGNPDDTGVLEECLSLDLGEVRTVLAGNGFLDVLPPGVSKGSALERLILAMPEDERPLIVAAAGDHMNDLELLEYADIAITMSDAQPSLLEMADIVLPPASLNGFSKILEPLEEASSEHMLSGWRKGCRG
jgi:hydroxymethylpyrimidine pyrophosphatase-like HAD family hydrolase